MSTLNIKSRSQLRSDAVVVTCNAKMLEIDSDIGFCMDRPMLEELVSEHRQFEKHLLVACPDKLQQITMSGMHIPETLKVGENLFHHAFQCSTGQGAFHCLLQAPLSEIWLAGFDGSKDARNQFKGRRHYGRTSTSPGVHMSWENRMRASYWEIKNRGDDPPTVRYFHPNPDDPPAVSDIAESIHPIEMLSGELPE